MSICLPQDITDLKRGRWWWFGGLHHNTKRRRNLLILKTVCSLQAANTTLISVVNRWRSSNNQLRAFLSCPTHNEVNETFNLIKFHAIYVIPLYNAVIVMVMGCC